MAYSPRKASLLQGNSQALSSQLEQQLNHHDKVTYASEKSKLKGWTEFNSTDRKTLHESKTSRYRRFASSNSIEIEDVPEKYSCVARVKKAFEPKCEFNEVGAANLKIKPGEEAGCWDQWGIYLCSSRFAKHTQFNRYYFALVSVLIMGQGSMLNLIYYMGLHGGSAFLVVLTFVYFSLGYLMYMFETCMGQYSGRKPMQMIRYMLPALTGIGPALYLRTIVKAVNALGIFVYSAHLAFGFFFCKPTENVLIYRFIHVEEHNKKFHLLSKSKEHYDNPGRLYGFHWMVILTAFLFVMVSLKLKVHGMVSMIASHIYAIFMFGYLLTGCSRAYYESQSMDSLTLVPLKATFKSDWYKLFSGRAWLDAMIFVVQSMELGTLVHPYLGSKSFFHYHCQRDGMRLVILAIVWNVGSAVAALAWLGYVGVSKDQMIKSSQHLFGHYGLFVVFMVKHLQAEMTGNVQGDILFFNAIFYSILGIAAFTALIIYLIILIDCSYPDSGHFLLKIFIMIAIVLFFGLGVTYFVVQPEGLRYLIYINFYVHKSWSAFFIIGCYFWAVGWGHDTGRFIHDYMNIAHYHGYRARDHAYFVPRVLRYVVLIFLGIGMICYIFARPYPHEGQTDWAGSHKYVGMACSCAPLLTVVSILTFNLCKNTATLKSHRNWYRNKHHISVCFADFADFKGIPGLQDPKDQRKKTKQPKMESESGYN